MGALEFNFLFFGSERSEHQHKVDEFGVDEFGVDEFSMLRCRTRVDEFGVDEFSMSVYLRRNVGVYHCQVLESHTAKC